METTRFFFVTAITLCLSAPTAVAQEQPKTQRNVSIGTEAFIGSWRIDVTRTTTAAVALSYEQTGDNIRATTPQGSYTFNVDGNDYPTAVTGEMISWKRIGENTIETTSKRNGKVDAVATRVFSPDRKTALVVIKILRGTPRTLTGKMERQNKSDNTNPLLGTWKQRVSTATDPNRRLTYTVIPNGLHARYEDAANPHEYDLILDQQQHQIGSLQAQLSARSLDNYTIEERWTREKTLAYTSTITVSADGQDLTERQQLPDAHSEPSIWVYHRVR
jgi:hypothetical protein